MSGFLGQQLELARCGIPELALASSRSQQRTVRRKGQGEHAVLVATEGGANASHLGCDIPNGDSPASISRSELPAPPWQRRI